MSSSHVDAWSLPTQNLFLSANRLPISDVLTQLSEREAQLERELGAIRAFRNTIAPVNRLPPELLSTIFIHLSHLSPEGNRKGSRPLAWIDAVLSVCEYWRNTALQCPALWSSVESEIFAGGFGLLESVINWSGNSPLKVEWTSPQSRQRRRGEVRQGLYRLLATQTARVQSLRIVNSVDTPSSLKVDVHDALKKMGKEAPALKELIVSADNDTPTFTRGDKGGLGAPLLEHLTLVGCRLVKWDALPLAGGNIKKLCLVDAPFRERPARVPHTRPTATQFLESLKQMPLLADLRLSGYLPLGGYSSAASPVPIRLPNLREITINDKSSTVAAFIGAIRAKNLKSVRAALVDERFAASDLDAFLRSFSTLLDGSTTGTRELCISPELHDMERRRHEFKFTLFREKESSDDTPASQPTPASTTDASNDLVLELSCHPGGTRGVDALFPAIVRTMDLSRLTHLFVETQSTITDCIPPITWSSVFGPLPHLRDIKVLGQPGLSLLYALRDHGNNSNDQQNATFRALASITIEESFTFSDKKVAMLIDVLSSRQTIQKLRLVDSDGFTKQHYEMVKETLPNLVVECV